MPKCKSCGAEILWIRSGRESMWVDSNLVCILPNLLGDTKIITDDEREVRGDRIIWGREVPRSALGLEGVETGYTLHTCPNAEKHRKT